MTDKAPPLALDASCFYTPVEAASVLRCSRAFVYELLGAGALTSLKNGRSRIIPGGAIAAYIDTLTEQATA